MSFSITPTEIPDVLEISSPVLGDERGFFTEVFNADRWGAMNFSKTFQQDNLSSSKGGTLRGLHYQIEPHAQRKLVRCLQGRIYDVAVDIREGSPTFGKWVGRELSGENGAALWVPAGFAHGFLALADDALVIYKCTTCYHKDAERSILWNDPAIGIEWPEAPNEALIAPKDAEAPTLAEADYNFIYQPIEA